MVQFLSISILSQYWELHPRQQCVKSCILFVVLLLLPPYNSVVEFWLQIIMILLMVWTHHFQIFPQLPHTATPFICIKVHAKQYLSFWYPLEQYSFNILFSLQELEEVRVTLSCIDHSMNSLISDRTLESTLLSILSRCSNG